MTRKTLLTLAVILCLANIAAATALIPRTVSVHGGARTVFGDDRTFAAGVVEDGEVKYHPLSQTKGAIGSALAVTWDGRLGTPLTYGVDLDLGFGEMSIYGVGLGVGYNIPFALDESVAYVQLKFNASYVMTAVRFGELQMDIISHGKRSVENPSLDLTNDYLTLRPEINYFRLLSEVRNVSFLGGVFIRASLGFNIPILEAGSPRLRFWNSGGDEFSVPVSNDQIALFVMDGESEEWTRTEKTDISSMGIVATLGFAFEF